jgi:hypothetical protein
MYLNRALMVQPAFEPCQALVEDALPCRSNPPSSHGENGVAYKNPQIDHPGTVQLRSSTSGSTVVASHDSLLLRLNSLVASISAMKPPDYDS